MGGSQESALELMVSKSNSNFAATMAFIVSGGTSNVVLQLVELLHYLISRVKDRKF